MAVSPTTGHRAAVLQASALATPVGIVVISGTPFRRLDQDFPILGDRPGVNYWVVMTSDNLRWVMGKTKES